MPGLCIIPDRALADAECRGPRMIALLAIGKFTGRDGGGVWAANDTLADQALMNEREFRRAAKWLVERGYVRKRVRYKASGAQDTNLLQIVLDDPDEATLALVGGGGQPPTPHEGEGATPPPPPGATPPPPLGATPPPRGGGHSPTKRTHLNDPSERPPATAAGARPRGLAQQLAAAANRAFDERFGPNRNPITSGTAANLLEAIGQHGIDAAFAVQAVYEAALKCEREPRSLHYFTAGVVERWEREQARGDAAAFVPGAPARPSRGRAPAAGVPIGDRTWSCAALWDLFVRGGLTAPMQSRDALAERVAALVRDGAVSDGGAFLALVVHVKPWALAEIKFAKTREDRLLELLASFHTPSQGAA